jgi:translin
MENLEGIGERIHHYLQEKNKARDEALHKSRVLIRHCSRAIRAIHRNERRLAKEHLDEARALAEELRRVQETYPDIYFAGYTRDALKEFAEANIVYAILGKEPLPDPDEIGVEVDSYLVGLGEAAGELRRRVLDILRHDDVPEGERLLDAMDDIYSYLVTVDFPDALTGNLRRVTDMVRGVTERTRGDMTTSIQQRELREALRDVEKKLDQK